MSVTPARTLKRRREGDEGGPVTRPAIPPHGRAGDAAANQQPQRMPEMTDLVLGALLRPGLVRLQHQPLEHQRVDVVLGDPHLVPEPGMGLEVIAMAHLGEQVTDRLHPLVELRLLHAVAAPRHADQLGLGHPPVRVDQESGQHDQGRTARQMQ